MLLNQSEYNNQKIRDHSSKVQTQRIHFQINFNISHKLDNTVLINK